jgi:uncharacterized peroxidase-related enzyme
LTKDDVLVEQLKVDPSRAPLEPPDRAMVDYVIKLTRAPATVSEDDIEALRAAGFDDRAILDMAQITAYFAFVTRMASGLGVALEEWTR